MNSLSKLSQENKKKLYDYVHASGLLRSITPKYMPDKNSSSIRESKEVREAKEIHTKVVKPSFQLDNRLSSQTTTSSSLYQKAQDNVLNAKLLAASRKKTQKKRTNDPTSLSKMEREDSSRLMETKEISYADFYPSPKFQSNKTLQAAANNALYNNFLKGKGLRKIGSDTVNKSAERQTSAYASSDLSNRKTVSKPAFKLDLSHQVQKHR